MLSDRKITKVVQIGNVKIGGGHPVAIQSMTNTDTRDVAATVCQINALEEAGCEIVRVAVPDMEAAEALREIKKQIRLPLAADVHFDYRLALRALANGVDKLRINPGNIGSVDRIKAVSDEARQRRVPIRIGVNSGSLEKDLVEKYGGVTAEGIVESALRHVKILEDMDFDDIIVAVKASRVPFTIECYKLLSEKIPYPLHVGVTEAGGVYAGSIKSAAGIGTILAAGIGDTIRVSLTGDPVEEVRCAREILKALELRKFGINVVSCPTCGRTRIDLISIANMIEEKCKGINKDITVAVMGCAVNGPGEAREADIGIAGGNGSGIIFKKGEIIRKVDEDRLAEELLKEIHNL